MLIKKKTKFSVAAIALSAMLMTATGPVFAKPSATIDVDYVALGDSLAAGVTPYVPDYFPYFNLNKSYSDYIAGKLDSDDVLGDYANYGFPLYTTDSILGLIGPGQYPDFDPLQPYSYPYYMRSTTDSFNPLASVPVLNVNTVRNSLSDAEIVTLDIGANDLLKLREWVSALLSLNPSDPSYSMNLVQLVNAYPGAMDKNSLSLVLTNPAITTETKLNTIFGAEITAITYKTGQIIQKINDIDEEDPQIYVMGYYNAFPDDPLFASVIENLNSAVMAEIAGEATYIATWDSFSKHLGKYLPEDNIHPSVQGYKTISQCFWEEIIEDFDF
jgi:lysophospholipase L1-like esterase